MFKKNFIPKLLILTSIIFMLTISTLYHDEIIINSDENIYTSYEIINQKSMVNNVTSAVPNSGNYISNKKNTLTTVKDYGAVGDGITDDSAAILSAIKDNPSVYFSDGTYKINSECTAALSDKNLNGTGTLKFDTWSNQSVSGTYTNVFDGTCDISKMDDSIYMASHWPSEASMTEDSRKNICVSTEIKLNNDIRKVCYHGGIVRVKDVTLPDTFTICLGKGQLYAYKNKQWVLLKDVLPNFALFDASWKNPSIKVPNNCIQKFEDHIEITLNKDLWFSNNDEKLLHYFCPSYELSAQENASDYEYFFVKYTAWIKEPEYSDCFSFGASIDMRDTQNKIYELGIGKMYLLRSTPRTAYFYNVPDSKYDELIAPYFSKR